MSKNDYQSWFFILFFSEPQFLHVQNGTVIPNPVVAGRGVMGKSFDPRLSFTEGFRSSFFISSPGEIPLPSRQYTIGLAEDSRRTPLDKHPVTICVCVCVCVPYIYILIKSKFIIELMTIRFQAPPSHRSLSKATGAFLEMYSHPHVFL